MKHELTEDFLSAKKYAMRARNAIIKAQNDYRQTVDYYESEYKEGNITEKYYKEKLQEADEKLSNTILSEQNVVRGLGRDYLAKAKEHDRLKAPNADVVAILNCGMTLTIDDYRELIAQNADDRTTIRYITDFYGKNPLYKESRLAGEKERISLDGIPQSRTEKAELYAQYVEELAHLVKSGVVPSEHRVYNEASQPVGELESYFNYLAKKRIADYSDRPTAEELAENFPEASHEIINKHDIW